MRTSEKLRWLSKVAWASWCPDPSCAGGMSMYDSNPDRDSCTNCNISGRDQRGLIGLTKPLQETWSDLDDLPLLARDIAKRNSKIVLVQDRLPSE